MYCSLYCYIANFLEFYIQTIMRVLKGKMGIGIGRFCPGEMGFKPHLDWDLVTGKWEKMLKIKNGNRI